jgi:hypothetical protein
MNSRSHSPQFLSILAGSLIGILHNIYMPRWRDFGYVAAGECCVVILNLLFGFWRFEFRALKLSPLFESFSLRLLGGFKCFRPPVKDLVYSWFWRPASRVSLQAFIRANAGKEVYISKKENIACTECIDGKCGCNLLWTPFSKKSQGQN